MIELGPSMESEQAHGARWELVRLAPSRIVFDVHRHVCIELQGAHAGAGGESSMDSFRREVAVKGWQTGPHFARCMCFLLGRTS